MEGVKKMVLQDGSMSLWRGLPPTLWRDVPFSAIYWMGYEEAKRAIITNGQFSELQTSFLAGALSGMVSSTHIMMVLCINHQYILVCRCYYYTV